MTIYDLHERQYTRSLTKITHIYKIKGNKKGYKFYSTYDECTYTYQGFALKDALDQYEKDTKWQNFASVRYFTSDEEVKEEFENINKE